MIGPGRRHYDRIQITPEHMRELFFQIMSTDSAITARWQKAFRQEGWLVSADASCHAGEEDCGKRVEIDLIELGIPDCRGPEDLKVIIKTRHPVSTLVFGDQQNVSNSQIAAFLEAGADDFVYKNLDERVLVAKLKANARRIMPTIVEVSKKLASSNGDIKTDRSRHTVKIKTAPGRYTELLNLTEKEFDILSMLIAHEQRVVSRDYMLEYLWGVDAEEVYSDCINKHIESLRKKLGRYGPRIKSIYGTGYMLTKGDNTY